MVLTMVDWLGLNIVSHNINTELTVLTTKSSSIFYHLLIIPLVQKAVNCKSHTSITACVLYFSSIYFTCHVCQQVLTKIFRGKLSKEVCWPISILLTLDMLPATWFHLLNGSSFSTKRRWIKLYYLNYFHNI